MRNAFSKNSKTIYQLRREELGLTLKRAANITNIPRDRLKEIETGKATATPKEVNSISSAYNQPNLINRYYFEECSIRNTKNKLLRKVNFEMIGKLLTGVATMVSTILVLLTLYEMKTQRNNAYKPAIIFETVTYSNTWEEYEDNSKRDPYISSFITDDVNPTSIKIPVKNIGVGVAKNISFSITDECFSVWNDLYNSQVMIEQNFPELDKYFPETEYSYTNDEYIFYPKVFLLPNAEETFDFIIPSFYLKTIRTLTTTFNPRKYTGLPNLEVHVSYQDVQGIKYDKTIYLDINVTRYYTNNFDSVCINYEIVMRDPAIIPST